MDFNYRLMNIWDYCFLNGVYVNQIRKFKSCFARETSQPRARE